MTQSLPKLGKFGCAPVDSIETFELAQCNRTQFRGGVFGSLGFCEMLFESDTSRRFQKCIRVFLDCLHIVIVDDIPDPGEDLNVL